LKFGHGSVWAKGKDLIDGLLEKHPNIKAPRLYELMKERESAYGSITSLRRYLKAQFTGRKEAFIKRSPLKGQEGQVDWAHFSSLDIDGHSRKLYCFVMVLAYSRKTYAEFTLDMSTGTFLNCHINAFKAFGGLPRVLLYDNLKSVVIERVGGAIRFNNMMMEFSGAYRFEARACNPARGNEKGRVERRIQHLRTNFFEARELTTLAALNSQVGHWLEHAVAQGRWPDDSNFTVADKYQEEKPTLMGLPEETRCWEISTVVQGNKYGYLRYDCNNYSIPPAYVQRALLVKSTPTKVKVYAGEELIATHERCWSKQKDVSLQSHIDAIVKVKPKAESGENSLKLSRDVPEIGTLLVMLSDRQVPLRQATAKFNLLRDRYGLAAFSKAIATALKNQTPSPESVQLLLEKAQPHLEAKYTAAMPLREDVRNLDIPLNSLDIYDQI
jgi:transposase